MCHENDEGTESEYLNSQCTDEGDDEFDEDGSDREARRIKMREADKSRVLLMVSRYTLAKNASVGSTITCPSCGVKFVKRSYQNTFCGLRGKNSHKKQGRKCKDMYWNSVDDGRNLRAVTFNKK